MTYVGFMWECECGHTLYGENAPAECPKCYRVDQFIKIPEEIAEERMKEEGLE